MFSYFLLLLRIFLFSRLIFLLFGFRNNTAFCPGLNDQFFLLILSGLKLFVSFILSEFSFLYGRQVRLWVGSLRLLKLICLLILLITLFLDNRLLICIELLDRLLSLFIFRQEHTFNGSTILHSFLKLYLFGELFHFFLLFFSLLFFL